MEPVQKLIVVNIDAATQDFIESKLIEGFIITHIVSLAPKYDKLLIIYALPVVK